MEYEAENNIINDIKTVFGDAECKVISDRRVEVKIDSSRITGIFLTSPR